MKPDDADQYCDWIKHGKIRSDKQNESAPKHYERWTQGGFMLAELLTALAILSALMSISFVAVLNHRKALKQRELDGIAREIFLSAQNHLSYYGAKNLYNLAENHSEDKEAILGHEELFEDPDGNRISFHILKSVRGSGFSSEYSGTSWRNSASPLLETEKPAKALAEETEQALTEEPQKAITEGFRKAEQAPAKEPFHSASDSEAREAALQKARLRGKESPWILNLILPFGSIDESIRLNGNFYIRYDYPSATILDVFYSETYDFGGTTDYNSFSDLSELDENERRNFPGGMLGFYGGAVARDKEYWISVA